LALWIDTRGDEGIHEGSLRMRCHAEKKHATGEKRKRKNIFFDISVVDQSVYPPVNDSPLLSFNIPVIGLFYAKRSKGKFAKSSKNKADNLGQ